MTYPIQKYLKIGAGNGDDDLSDYWFDQIGWVGYYFAQLEWASYWLAEEVGTPAQKTAVASKAFVSRNLYSQKNIAKNLSDVALRVEWATFFDDINACADMRNNILHNPLAPNMEDIKNRGVRLDQGIQLLRDSGAKVIELGEVQHFTNNLRALNSTMISLMNRTIRKT